MRLSSGLMPRMTASTRVALLEHVAGVADLFAPGHFGDVDEAFDAGLNFNEGAEVG